MPKIDFSQMITAEAAGGAALAALRAEVGEVVAAQVAARLLALTGPVPLEEKLSWAAKEEAARQVLGGPDPAADPKAAALLVAEAEQTGEEIAALAHRILDKAVAYRQALSQLTGWRRGMMQRIEAARSLHELQLVREAVPETVPG